MVKNCDLGHSFSPYGPPSRQITYIDLSFYYSNIKPFNPLSECGSTERSNVDFFPGQEFLSSSEYLLVIKNILMVSFVLFSFFA